MYTESLDALADALERDNWLNYEKDDNETKYKKDEGKLRYELIPDHALEGVAKSFTFGATKYGPRSYMNIPKENRIERTFGSILRHLYSTKKGDLIDKESGNYHIDNCICQLMILREFLKEDGKIK